MACSMEVYYRWHLIQDLQRVLAGCPYFIMGVTQESSGNLGQLGFTICSNERSHEVKYNTTLKDLTSEFLLETVCANKLCHPIGSSLQDSWPALSFTYKTPSLERMDLKEKEKKKDDITGGITGSSLLKLVFSSATFRGGSLLHSLSRLFTMHKMNECTLSEDTSPLFCGMDIHGILPAQH